MPPARHPPPVVSSTHSRSLPSPNAAEGEHLKSQPSSTSWPRGVNTRHPICFSWARQPQITVPSAPLRKRSRIETAAVPPLPSGLGCSSALTSVTSPTRWRARSMRCVHCSFSCPPERAGSPHQGTRYAPPTQCAVKPSTVPLSSRLRTRRTEGRYRFMYPTEVIVPVFRQAISAGRHCAADSPIGFSRKSGTPAWAASSSTGPRANGGVQTKAASSSRQRTLATSVTISQPGWLLASADARTTSTSHATLTRWPSWDALRACCSPIRPHPKIATRSASGGWSMDIFGLYGATDLAHLRLGHHRIERQGLLDPLQGGRRDCLEQRSFMSGPSVEPRLYLRRWLVGDDFHAKARNPRR